MNFVEPQAGAIFFQRFAKRAVSHNFKMDCRREPGPRHRKKLRPFLLRKPAEKKRAISATHAGAGIAGDEIWFDTHARSVEARVDKFLASKFRADQKQV